MRPIETTKLRKRAAAIAAAAGLGALAVVALPATSVTAAGNPNFDGILAAAAPTGFPVSPQSGQLGKGGLTLNFDVNVRNLTSQSQTVALNFSVSHILTYNGKNIADGQPGQPGITFAGPKGTTQVRLPGTQSFSTTFAPKQQRSLHRTYSIDTCGYFQIDIWAPEQHPQDGARHRETLASGFTRMLGCKAVTAPAPKPSGGGGLGGVTVTPTPGGGNGTSPLTGGSAAASISTPSTGSAILGGALGLGGLLVLLGTGALTAGNRRNRDNF